jgi:SNF2 family DNA or RNA helicase
MERRGTILTTLMKLKQICNHPAVFLKEEMGGSAAAHPMRSLISRSEKLERLLEMVTELRSEGDRCLIFTQFVQTGRLLQRVLAHELGEEVLFLHGGVSQSQREEFIASFQAEAGASRDGPGVFILSLKAGGVGLNLTAANHVFHFDRWWNPAVENQATDRAYRIGQQRHVQVFKFVTLGTLEERIDEMLETKQSLSNQVMGSSGENWITEMSTDDLRTVFALRREWVEG